MKKLDNYEEGAEACMKKYPNIEGSTLFDERKKFMSKRHLP